MSPSTGTPLLWGGFAIIVLVLLALDLFVFHRKSHVVKVREALIWSGVWIGLSLAFAGFVFFRSGSGAGLDFLTGYVIEKALSIDNLFVFMVVFAHFKVPPKDQHHVLFWGVLGALVMRGVFIAGGLTLLAHFHWLTWVFGGLLILSAVKLLLQKEEAPDPEKGLVLRLVRRIAPRLPTMALVIIVVEATDVVFAVDSIPAIFAVTTDPFLVYTSNIFAILGLRSLYFALAGVMDKFRYLKPALALVLGFVGVKMLIAGVVKVPVVLSLGVILLLLGGGVAASLIFPAHAKPQRS